LYPVHAQTYRPLSAIRLIKPVVIRKQTFKHITNRVPTYQGNNIYKCHATLVHIPRTKLNFPSIQARDNLQVLLDFVILHVVYICKFELFF